MWRARMGRVSRISDSTRSSHIKSAERVLVILAFLARRARPVPTMTIARECGLPRSSAYHLLNVMRARDFVPYYAEERAWGLGVAVFEIGSAYLRIRRGWVLWFTGRPDEALPWLEAAAAQRPEDRWSTSSLATPTLLSATTRRQSGCTGTRSSSTLITAPLTPA